MATKTPIAGSSLMSLGEVEGEQVYAKILWDPQYREQYTPDASQIVALMECRNNQSQLVRRQVLGFVKYTPAGNETLPYFERTLPLQHPQATDQYALGMAMVRFGPDSPEPLYSLLDEGGNATHAYAPRGTEDIGQSQWGAYTQTKFGIGPRPDGWPHIDWSVYALTLGTLPYVVRPDHEVQGQEVPELSRFVRRHLQYETEMKPIATGGFEAYDADSGNTVQTIPEAGFVPRFGVEMVYTAIGWPVEAYPAAAIAACIGCVNDDVFDGWNEGCVRYDGPASGIEPYRSPAGQWLIDIPHRLVYRPPKSVTVGGTTYDGGGWNTAEVSLDLGNGTHARVWRPVRVAGTTNPPFGPAPLGSLFLPPGTAFDWWNTPASPPPPP